MLKKSEVIKCVSKLKFIGNSICLEASSMCKLKCPICPTSSGYNKNGVIGWGNLKFKNFKKLIEDNPTIKNIELSNYGEMFLNPELKNIIKYAYTKNINLTAGNGVNLNSVDREIIEYLIKYKFRYITISIDGTTNDTYQIYRKNGDLNKVIQNIKSINYYKKKYVSELPKLCWQFVIMGHNEKELPLARKLAKGLYMEFRPKLNCDESFSPVKDKEFVRRESGLGVASRDEFRQKYNRNFFLPCSQMWTSPQINWDGKLLGCCINKWDDYGNVFESSLCECLKSERYIYAKKMLIGIKKARDDIPCSKCSTYRRIAINPLRKKKI